MAKWKLNEKAIKEQITKAKEQTRLADEVEPRATAAYYEQGARRIVVELSNGADFRFSPSSVQELVSATPDELAQVEVSPSGRTLRWQKLDADLSLPGLMAGIFGTKLWMAHLGQIGGQATSEAKAEAARLNGMKGGRPKKVVDMPGRKTSHSGTWKAKSVHTSPVRKLSDTPSRKAAKSPRTLVRASALGNIKTHSRTSRTLKDSGRAVTRRSDKKRKK
jgi:Protein of unknown function (DUF2442)